MFASINLICLCICILHNFGALAKDDIAVLKYEVESLKSTIRILTKSQYAMETQIEKLTGELAEFRKERLPMLANNFVAFQAYLNDDVRVDPEAKIPFQRVTVNEGDGFQGNDAEFVCPVSGLYFILVTSLSDGGGSTQIIHTTDSTDNGLSALMNSADTWTHAANGAVVVCGAGEKIWVKNSFHNDVIYKATMSESDQQSIYQTSFIGFLVALS